MSHFFPSLRLSSRRRNGRPAAPPFRPRLEELERRLAPAVFTVSNANDSGVGSLRQAILAADAAPGLDTINFSIGSGRQTITLQSPLPFVTDPAILDGTTQPGYAGSPLIDLDGLAVGAANGLVVTAGGTLVRGLAVADFGGIGVLLAQGGGDVVVNNAVGAPNQANAFGVVVAGGGADQIAGNVIDSNTFYGLTLNNTAGNVVAGNLIGVNAADTAAAGNGVTGVTLNGAATGNVLSGNIIGGNKVFGVLLYGPGVTGDVLAGNYVGLNPAGAALANGVAGVALGAGASGNMVGGPTAAYRNVISGNAVDGVYVAGAGTNNNVIESDYVGTNPAGTGAVGNGAGVVIQDGAANNLVGADLLSGNSQYGVVLQGPGTAGNVVGSCLVGSSAAGNAALGNGRDGALIAAGASDNLISSDLLSASFAADVHLNRAGAGNVVQASLIGTNLAGTAALGETFEGVMIEGASDETVGGPTAAQRNVIGGPSDNGIQITQFPGEPPADGNVVMNNYVGTNAAGTTVLTNRFGIAIDSGESGNTVADNVVAGSMLEGIFVAGSGNLLEGNRIGTNAAGTAALGNVVGVEVVGAGNTVGGATAAARNVISGNDGAGVLITDSAASGNVVEGNFIGTQADGATPLGNGAWGVLITSQAANNTVGGTAAGAGNLIAFNGDDGVLVGGTAGSTGNALAGTGNSVLGNSIFGNGKVGIDLGPDDGVTPNGSAGTTGPNNYQPFPVLTSATASGGAVLVAGTLSTGVPVAFYRVELFASPSADPSGHGQGQVFLGFATALTDNSGNATFAAILAGPLAPGEAVSATASDASGDTSEFSADVIAQ
jgi:titin